MRTPKDRYVALVVCLLVLSGGMLVYSRMVMQRIPKGEWGGTHISMNVGDASATIEYDCAHATIDQRITLDRYGRFSVSGKQFSEHGGPVRQEDEEGRPARFSGQVKGNSMALKVENSATRELIGNFVVVYGARARLFKCK